MTELEQLIERWTSDEGKPYKGTFIDMDAYSEAPADIGCMCAQGQVLHLIGGWDASRLHDAGQVEADAETAKLLNISRAHAVLLRTVNDRSNGAPSSVLTDPEKVLGGQWSKLLDFWSYLDGMSGGQWDAAGDAAGADAWADARDAAWDAARDAAWDAAWAAAWASSEIQGADILHKKGKNLFFLPYFGFSSLSDIPPRPVGYGVIDHIQEQSK